MFVLSPIVRDYAWGSPILLAELEGREPTGAPEAEMWLGAHPGAPCAVVAEDGTRRGLDELIAENPERMLGPAAGAGRLPYLMKLLAAARPLSIQAHPTLEQARAGFAAEEAAGVPADAPHRNYKDDNHKPEMIVALTPFSALCGFRRPEEARATFERLAQALTEYSDGDATAVAVAARRLAVLLQDEDVEGAFTAVLDPASVWTAEGGVDELVEALRAMPELVAQDEALATALEAAEHFPGDPGVLVTLLLNRVDLMPGQAIHLPAGNVHAYLEGLGVEVMAASDNVLRGGLTPKHVDVPELQRVVAFEPLPVPYTGPEEEGPGVLCYRPPFEEFELARLSAADASPAEALHRVNGPAVAVAVAGRAVLGCGGRTVRLRPGQAVFVPAAETAGAPLRLTAEGSEEAVVYAASLPSVR
ncbi:mannose-6-phosphate isomerase, class I [Micrococcus sp.]|uniref:mannose-6-phosphate isomerase, class I n=1 Tax=Micrococcus sp. TaxID=1271 RepID=UPI002A912EB1|nr:mannose-6-phosphate isomerase, class I [Micrococcus sp.]MDY6055348.1 mannose-6-phosphate isomerase, class I [Micrococcus sp.]